MLLLVSKYNATERLLEVDYGIVVEISYLLMSVCGAHPSPLFNVRSDDLE